MITKEQIEKFIDKTGKLNANYYKDFEFPTDNIGKYVYDIYNDITDPPRCSICKKELTFLSFNRGYKEFCSKKCEYIKYPERKKKYKKREYKNKFTLYEKSVEYFRKSNNINHLIIPEEYTYITPTEYLYLSTVDFTIPICENPVCNNKPPFLSFDKGYQRTCCSRCAGALTSTLDKRKKTVKGKYGVEFVAQLEKSTEKAKATKLKKYGDAHYNNMEKNKQTCLERYGVDNIFKNLELRKNYEQKRVDSIRANSTEENNWIFRDTFDPNIEKRKQTCLEKYGVEHYVQSDEFKEKSPEIVKKIWKTKKKNGTTNTSEPENKIAELLIAFFGDQVKREYVSEKYPFHCDFFIPSEELYIEYHGFFTHGGRAFFNTDDDKNKINKWKSQKNSQFIEHAIKGWTVMDVNKRNIAYENNLNFIEIYDNTKIFTQIRRVICGLGMDNMSDEMILKHFITKNRNFQNPLFEKENKIFQNDLVARRKIIQERMKTLEKKEHELTDMEIIQGVKLFSQKLKEDKNAL